MRKVGLPISSSQVERLIRQSPITSNCCPIRTIYVLKYEDQALSKEAEWIRKKFLNKVTDYCNTLLLQVQVENNKGNSTLPITGALREMFTALEPEDPHYVRNRDEIKIKGYSCRIAAQEIAAFCFHVLSNIKNDFKLAITVKTVNKQQVLEWEKSKGHARK